MRLDPRRLLAKFASLDGDQDKHLLHTNIDCAAFNIEIGGLLGGWLLGRPIKICKRSMDSNSMSVSGSRIACVRIMADQRRNE